MTDDRRGYLVSEQSRDAQLRDAIVVLLALLGPALAVVVWLLLPL